MYINNKGDVIYMALIKCSECGKEASDKANACPNCGAPIKEDPIKKEINAGINVTKKLAIVLIIVLSLIILFAFIFGYFIPAHTHYVKDSDGYYNKEFRLFN